MSNQNYPNYQSGPPPVTPYPGHAQTPPGGSGSFIEHLHNVGKSGLFLAGIILFTAGTLLTMAMSFSIFTVISLLLAALPITGLWLIFAASKSPKLPEKTLTALTLIKIYVIFMLVLMCLATFAVLIAYIFAFIGVSAVGGGFAAVLITFLLTMAIMAVIIIFYYVAAIRVIGSIRQNIVHNTFNPLRGVMPLTVTAVLAAILGILASLIGLAVIATMGHLINFWMDDIMWIISMEAPELLDYGILSMLEGLVASLTLTLLFNLLTYIGSILLIVSLNKLANVTRR